MGRLRCDRLEPWAGKRTVVHSMCNTMNSLANVNAQLEGKDGSDAVLYRMQSISDPRVAFYECLRYKAIFPLLHYISPELFTKIFT